MDISPDDFSDISIDYLITQAGWQKKYRLLMQWSSRVGLKPDLRKDEYLLAGCEAKAWLYNAGSPDSKRHYFFDSDSKIIKGLAALIFSIVSGLDDDALAELDLSDVLQRAGLEKHITPSRSNGLNALLGAIRA